LYLFIFVKSHPQFKREGLNIICYLSISFPAAVLGAELEVPTLDGKEKLEIPPGTQNGAVFRLRGKGMSGLNGMSRGDQMVLIEVEVPRKINDRQKELLQEFAKISGVNLNSSKGFMGKLKDVFGGS
jgi:molecular chaperone DnaJ